jgi:GNAT superfamily N-acetyltransferase
VESDQHQTWVAYQQGAIAGYFELHRQGDEVEILYFGLAPQFIGKGLGGFLLSEAIAKAWQWQGANRVWVHTCTLDHPHALKNYQARGFRIYKEEVEAE